MSIPCAAAKRLIASDALRNFSNASGPSVCAIVPMKAVKLSLSCPLPNALTPATIVGRAKSLGRVGICLLRCKT